MMTTSAAFGNLHLSYTRGPTASTWAKDVVRWVASCGSATDWSIVPASAASTLSTIVSQAYKYVYDLIRSFAQPAATACVDQQAADDAISFFNQLISLNVPAPKVFPSGGEAVIFTWERPSGRDYLHYEDGIVTLTHIPCKGDEWQIDLDLSDPTVLTSLSIYLRR